MESRTYAFKSCDSDIGYDQEDLWVLPGRTEYVNIFDLDIFSKCWSRDNRYYSLMDVADNPNLFPERIRRDEEASLEYPIIITEKNQILDGNHRVLKSILMNRYMIKIYRD